MREALVARIMRAPGFYVAQQQASLTGLAPGDLVLTTTTDCSLQQCAEQTRGGVKVVLLAPVLREAERASYALAGGRYIPMLVDTRQLFEVLAGASRGERSRIAGA